MSGLVIDPSAILGLALGDEESDYASAVLAAAVHTAAVAPSIFWYEIRNALLTGERRGRITEEQSAAFLEEFSHLLVENAGHPPPAGTLVLARGHDLTVYDAAYLELSIRRVLPLATLDRKLREAARSVDVEIFGGDEA